MPDKSLADEINEAIGVHGAWKMRLRTAINSGRTDIAPEQARCDDACPFDLWLDRLQLDPARHGGLSRQLLRQLHAGFHHSAGDVLSLALKRERHAARMLMDGEFSRYSARLAQALSALKNEAA